MRFPYSEFEMFSPFVTRVCAVALSLACLISSTEEGPFSDCPFVPLSIKSLPIAAAACLARSSSSPTVRCRSLSSAMSGVFLAKPYGFSRNIVLRAASAPHFTLYYCTTSLIFRFTTLPACSGGNGWRESSLCISLG